MQLYAQVKTLQPKTLATKLALATLGAVVTAACAQLAVYLPGNPIPITGQVFGVVLCAFVLGSKLGALSQLEYLAMGLAGAPVFSGFRGGVGHLLGPTGGYLIGFIIAAYVIGRIVEFSKRKDISVRIKAGVVGIIVIYTCGVGWLRLWAQFFGLPFVGWQAWLVGAMPFIWLDLAKVSLAAVIRSKSRR